MHDYDEQDDHPQEGRGRSAKKRQAKAVELLAQRLTELSEAELAALPKLPELDKEIELARSTRGHSSRKRQIKHLAGLLRGLDEQREALAAALDGQEVNKRREVMAFRHLEALRDRLCSRATCEEALQEVRSSYPQLDDARLARLAGSVHEHNDKRAAREIFRRLRAAEEAREDD